MTRSWLRRTSVGCIAGLLAAAPGLARGDDRIDGVGPVVVGSRVRLQAPSVLEGRIEGLVLDADDHVLLVGSDHGPPLRIPRDAVARLEVSTGRRGHAVQGTLIGGAIGGLAFGVIDEDEYCVEYYDPTETCPNRAQMIGIGIIGGAAWGLLIGHLVKGDRWSKVPLERVQVSLAPARARGGLGLSLSVGW